jgi:hypothetical protein
MTPTAKLRRRVGGLGVAVDLAGYNCGLDEVNSVLATNQHSRGCSESVELKSCADPGLRLSSLTRGYIGARSQVVIQVVFNSDCGISSSNAVVSAWTTHVEITGPDPRKVLGEKQRVLEVIAHRRRIVRRLRRAAIPAIACIPAVAYVLGVLRW